MQSLIDLGRYPIDCKGSSAYRNLIRDIQAELAEDGCAVLKGFVRPEGVAILTAEADRVADQAHRSYSRTNVYFSKDDPTLPEDHPVRQFYDRSNSFIPGDNFDAQSQLRSIYEWPEFSPFIREALGEPEDRFFRYDDPLADVIVNRVEEGAGFPWHFDTNNFTVTLAIQNGEEGGAFEYVPDLRSSSDENFDGVGQVLSGDRSHVVSLLLEPGDLQIFRGRYSLHRVTGVKGDRNRYVGIFSFVEKEGMCGSPERTMQLYGRILPRHTERAGLRADALRD